VVILGINSAYHESSAALLVDGVLVAAAEDERFSRIKHGKHSAVDNAHDLPWKAAKFCLDRAGLRFSDVDRVGYSFDPWVRRAAVWSDHSKPQNADFGTPEGERVFFESNLRARDLILARMPRAQFHFLSHHRCHAASAYLVSPFSRAGVLVVDGIAESASTWAGFGDSQLRNLFEVEYPNSLGFLWEKVCEFLGFDRYDGPGKVMALGTVSDSRDIESGVDYREAFGEFVCLKPEGQFTIAPEILGYRGAGFEGLERVLGPRDEFTLGPARRSSIAAGLQQATEEVLAHVAGELWRRINSGRMDEVSDLCLAGGVALNCAANRTLLERTPWKRLWIQPAAHDGGTALGAALLVWNEKLGKSQRPEMQDAYLGPSFSDQECEAALLRAGLPFERPAHLPRRVASLVSQGHVAGWFQGRMEFGPRALGNRSILADPRRTQTRTVLNRKIKERECFRPFAPSVLADDAARWFPMPGAGSIASGPGEFMLVAASVSADGPVEFPAVVHRNRHTGAATARVHVVKPGRNPLYEEFLNDCRETLGAGVSLNTSFNVAEPIVCSPDDACGTFIRSGLDAMAIGSYLVIRQ
jgi:carbamoyltransferase